MPGYFRGLSSPSVTLKKNDFGSFAEIVAGGANEIADVLDEQQAGALETHFVEMTIDHASIEMAGASGDNLADGKPVAREAAGVVIRLNVAGENGDGVSGVKEARVFSRSAVLPEPGELMRLTQKMFWSW